jgi:ribosomal protein L11 methyltransferase
LAERRAPALRLSFPDGPPDSEASGLILALLDDHAPLAIDDSARLAWLVYFASPGIRDAAGAALASARWPAEVNFEAVDVPDEDWAARTQRDLAAVCVGDLVVAPPWDMPSQGSEPTRVIVIEPSMGFGTGHHESTRLCLRALQELTLSGQTVLDIGTGSGVLAVAAALLGARDVLGIDADADAVQAARDNVGRNGVANRVRVRHAPVDEPSLAPADVVLANLTGALLQRSAGALIRLVGPGGVLVTSGFTIDEAPRVRAAYSALGWPRTLEENSWVAAIFESRTANNRR